MINLFKDISQEKLVELRCAFDLFDGDNDGKIDPSELGKAIEKMGQKLSEDDLKEMIKEVDSDYNGTIEFDEFVTLMISKMKDNDSEEEIYEAFKIFDKKGNGKVSKSDIKSVMNTLHEPITNPELDELIEKWDSDRDGFLNFQEFKNMMLFK